MLLDRATEEAVDPQTMPRLVRKQGLIEGRNQLLPGGGELPRRRKKGEYIRNRCLLMIRINKDLVITTTCASFGFCQP